MVSPIHDEKVVRRLLDGQAVWLEPFSEPVHDPFVAALARIEVACEQLILVPGQELEDLNKLQCDTRSEAWRTSGKGYSGLKTALSKVLQTLETKVGHPITWCFTFMDFDIHWYQCRPILDDLLLAFGFPNALYFLICDGSLSFFSKFERRNQVIAIETDELKDLIHAVQKSMPPPLAPELPSEIDYEWDSPAFPRKVSWLRNEKKPVKLGKNEFVGPPRQSTFIDPLARPVATAPGAPSPPVPAPLEGYTEAELKEQGFVGVYIGPKYRSLDDI